ncbi:MAG: helix-turn-helix domain-containing protein [Clostridiales bacterium]|nr:helix-turn-helix domain-containing protein [Clostridiales bacterium]
MTLLFGILWYIYGVICKKNAQKGLDFGDKMYYTNPWSDAYKERMWLIMIFGQQLKKLRQEMNMTQEEFAKQLGTSKQVVSRYEKNQRAPKITIVDEYARKLGVPVDFFYDDVHNKSPKQGYIKNIGHKIPHQESNKGKPIGDNLANYQITINDLTNIEKRIIIDYRSLSPEEQQQFLGSLFVLMNSENRLADLEDKIFLPQIAHTWEGEEEVPILLSKEQLHLLKTAKPVTSMEDL